MFFIVDLQLITSCHGLTAFADGQLLTALVSKHGHGPRSSSVCVGLQRSTRRTATRRTTPTLARLTGGNRLLPAAIARAAAWRPRTLPIATATRHRTVCIIACERKHRIMVQLL